MNLNRLVSAMMHEFGEACIYPDKHPLHIYMRKVTYAQNYGQTLKRKPK